MSRVVAVGLVVIVGLAVVFLVLCAGLAIARPRGVDLRATVRLLPDTIRLLKRIAFDRAVPLRVRVRVWLLLAYLLFPIDLVPDFIPVIGYADDVIVTVLALRGIVRQAGTATLERHWSGTPEGLAEVWRLLGTRATS